MFFNTVLIDYFRFNFGFLLKFCILYLEIGFKMPRGKPIAPLTRRLILPEKYFEVSTKSALVSMHFFHFQNCLMLSQSLKNTFFMQHLDNLVRFNGFNTQRTDLNLLCPEFSSEIFCCALAPNVIRSPKNNFKKFSSKSFYLILTQAVQASRISTILPHLKHHMRK